MHGLHYAPGLAVQGGQLGLGLVLVLMLAYNFELFRERQLACREGTT